MLYLKNNKIKYDNYMDAEVLPLCDSINSLPGLITTESCCGHNKNSFSIFFRVSNRFDGLFFLARCADRRYWEFGHLWKIELSVGDHFETELPLNFIINSGSIIGKEATIQANSLVDNMNYHLNHINFMKYYKFNIDDFQYFIKEAKRD